MVRAAWTPDWIATSATPGNVVEGHQVADDEDLGVSRQRAVGFDHDAAGLVELRAGRCRKGGAESSGARPCRPDLGCGRDVLGRAIGSCDLNAPFVHVGDHGAEVDLDALVGEFARRHLRQPVAHGADQPVGALNQDDAGLVGIDAPVVVAERPARQLLELPCHLHSGRPAADDDERHETLAFAFVVLGFRQLERAENLSPQRQGVVERLESAGHLLEFVVTEVRGRGAAGHDQTVIGDGEGLSEFVGHDGAGVHVDALDVRQDHLQPLVVAEDVAGWRCDLPFREDAGRHLIEQGLKEMVVGPVNQRHPDRSQFQGPGGEQPAEARPDDDDVVPIAGRVASVHRRRSTTVAT